LRDIQLDEIVLSFGFGLPIQNQKSRIDMSFEFGKQGTTNKNLIQENFFRFRLGFSLKDAWFSRPKYN
jgi:D-ribose pyranose/furanose isomerase RbsD